MAGFDRRRRAAMDTKLSFLGRGWIRASLFDLGLYPAAVPSPDGCVWGELYEVSELATVLPALDEIEGYRPGDTDHSLYVRAQADVTLPDGRVIFTIAPAAVEQARKGGKEVYLVILDLLAMAKQGKTPPHTRPIQIT